MLSNVRLVMRICTMCLWAVRKGWLFLIRKYCFAFTPSSKRKSRKSLFKCVDGITPAFKGFLSSWFMELKGEKKNRMEIVCTNFVLRSLYLMQVTGVPNDACFIIISTKLCIPNSQRAFRQSCMPLIFHMNRSIPCTFNLPACLHVTFGLSKFIQSLITWTKPHIFMKLFLVFQALASFIEFL